ncbi:MAG: DNA-directed RNA polymerase subunit omega [Candidatus Latescibacterota bacterium]|nr:MAG: DNA-directed RNA polymerase subunit omega [Candidatus Latescibacterota bacterium]
MAYVPVEKVTETIQNKYEAIVVAAREARKINSVMRMVGRDETKDKVTSRALNRVGRGDVDFVYVDEQTPIHDPAETTENEEQISPN